MATTNHGSSGAAAASTISTTDAVVNVPAGTPSAAVPHYSQDIPDPRGTEPLEEQEAQEGANTDPTAGVGVEGEVTAWEATYSGRNFIGRGFFCFALTIGWVALATYTWGMGHERLAGMTWVAGGVVLVLWIAMFLRMIQAQFSHHYRLTNRRLFVSTGIIHRRQDMMELMRIKDVFTRQQSLLERLLGLGTVVVVPSEKEIPTFYLTGVDDPQEVMDLIWHHARAERDQRSVKVEEV
jgi:membrane protein YdbS with pleckstrin-like domain